MLPSLLVAPRGGPPCTHRAKETGREMGGAFSRGKNRVERIGPTRRQSMPSNAGASKKPVPLLALACACVALCLCLFSDTLRWDVAGASATPARRPETCPAVPSPAADTERGTERGTARAGLIYRAPEALSGLISADGPILVHVCSLPPSSLLPHSLTHSISRARVCRTVCL